MNLTIILGLLFVLTFNKTIANVLITQQNETEAARYLDDLNDKLTSHFNKANEDMFAYYSNVTKENELKLGELFQRESSFMKKVADDMSRLNWRSYTNSDIHRKFKLLPTLGFNLRNDTEFKEYSSIKKKLSMNYKQAKVCDYKNRTQCDKNVANGFHQNNDNEELIYYWKQIRQKTGESVRGLFEDFVRLSNEIASFNNLTSRVDMLLDDYEDNTIEQQLDDVVIAIRPLFEQIHAFLRHRMQQIYGENVVSSRGPIPTHLLDYLLHQDPHHSAYPFLPYPRKEAINITQELLNQTYTPLKMFELGDAFFMSMNMTKLPQSFWRTSILEKPNDGRKVICGPLAWDMYIKDDVRLIQCTLINQEHFIEMHRQLSTVQYTLQYQNQPFLYRSFVYFAMRKAFPEAVILSVTTPKHLQRIGLLPNYVPDEEERMNRLFLTALKSIFKIPFMISQEKFIWALFRNEFEKEKWNCAFWKFRGNYSGIEPPVKRTNIDFDLPALYGDSSYKSVLSEIGSLIVQFQLYKSACVKASQYDPNNPELPLDNCDFYGSSKAGNSFSDMLSLGNSKPWPDVLEAFNGERKMNASAMVEYFKPLESWLRAENAKNGVFVGWTESDKCSA